MSSEEEKAESLSPTPLPNQHRLRPTTAINIHPQTRIHPPIHTYIEDSSTSSSDEEEYSDTSEEADSVFQTFEESYHEIYILTHRSIHYTPFQRKVTKYYKVFDLYHTFIRNTIRITLEYH